MAKAVWFDLSITDSELRSLQSYRAAQLCLECDGHRDQMRHPTVRRRCTHLACDQMVIFAFILRDLVGNVLQLMDSVCVRHGRARLCEICWQW